MIELNRKPSSLKRYERIIVLLVALIIGIGIGISGFEGSFNGFNQNYLFFPIAAILFYKMYRYKISYALKFWDYPFTAFFITSLIIYFGFVFIFVTTYGFQTNPGTDLNWAIKLQF